VSGGIVVLLVPVSTLSFGSGGQTKGGQERHAGGADIAHGIASNGCFRENVHGRIGEIVDNCEYQIARRIVHRSPSVDSSYRYPW
jgi:hypothetical protein